MLVRQMDSEQREDFDEWLDSDFERKAAAKTAAEQFEERQMQVEHPVEYVVVPEGEVISFGGAR
jgi:hypothetical protein